MSRRRPIVGDRDRRTGDGTARSGHVPAPRAHVACRQPMSSLIQNVQQPHSAMLLDCKIEIISMEDVREIDVDDVENVSVKSGFPWSTLTFKVRNGADVALHGLLEQKAKALQSAVLERQAAVRHERKKANTEAELERIRKTTDTTGLENAEAVIEFTLSGTRLLQETDVRAAFATVRHPGIPTDWPEEAANDPLIERLARVREFAGTPADQIRRDANDIFIERAGPEIAAEAVAAERKRVRDAAEDGRLDAAEAAMDALLALERIVQTDEVVRAIELIAQTNLPADWAAEADDEPSAARLRRLNAFKSRSATAIVAEINNGLIGRYAAELAAEAMKTEVARLHDPAMLERLKAIEHAAAQILQGDRTVQRADIDRLKRRIEAAALPTEWAAEATGDPAVGRLKAIAETGATDSETLLRAANDGLIARCQTELTADAVEAERKKLQDPSVLARLRHVESEIAALLDGERLIQRADVERLKELIVRTDLPRDWADEVAGDPEAKRLAAAERVCTADTEALVRTANDALIIREAEALAAEAVDRERRRLAAAAPEAALKRAEAAATAAADAPRILQTDELGALRNTASAAGLPNEWPSELDGTALTDRLAAIRTFTAEPASAQLRRLNNEFIQRHVKALTAEALEAQRLLLASRTDVDALAQAETLIGEVTQPRRQLLVSRMAEIRRRVAAVALPAEWPAEIDDDELPQRIKVVRAFNTADGSRLLKDCNERFTTSELEGRRELFDNIEKSPLTQEQRLAVCSDDARNLVVAAAGSGKSSVMVAKAALIEDRRDARRDEILMLAYGKKAAQELKERIENRLGAHAAQLIAIRTFHSLGTSIIADAEDEKPALAAWAADPTAHAARMMTAVEDASKDPEYGPAIVDWLAYGGPPADRTTFESMEEYDEYTRRKELRTLQGEKVKSREELAIANFLFVHQVPYKYEDPYPRRTATRRRRRYEPDFHLTRDGIYIEHFAIDSDGDTPPFIDREDYLADRRWKQKFHERHGSRLIETFSGENADGRLTERLRAKLEAEGVAMTPRPTEELLDLLNEKQHVSHFARLVGEFLTHMKGAGLSPVDAHERAARAGKSRAAAFARMVAPIHRIIEKELSERGEIDFEDMIGKATGYVLDDVVRPPWRYVLVDEFQDISQGRAKLLKALLERGPETRLFAVGDDWQSIFGFAGSDTALMLDFDKHFGAGTTKHLTTTFRCPDGLCTVADEFIRRNPRQIQKTVKARTERPGPGVKIGLGGSPPEELLDAALAEIAAANGDGPRPEVLVLSRYRSQQPPTSALKRRHPRLKIKSQTAHSAKGIEAEYCVIVGMRAGRYGFPSEIEDDTVLDAVRAAPEAYPYAEERRLFYVALTRAKRTTYVIEDIGPRSIFVDELLRSKTGRVATFGDPREKHGRCPECERGHLVLKRTREGETFFGCSSSPDCRATAPTCPACGKGRPKRDGYGRNRCPECRTEPPPCPMCEGWLYERKGRHGPFTACSRREDGCRYTVNKSRSSWRR